MMDGYPWPTVVNPVRRYLSC